MKRITPFSPALSGLVLLALFAGCAKPPQKEIESANTTLEAARAANAERFAADELAAAREKLDAALNEVEIQDNKKLLKSYNRAKVLLSEATAQAAKARAAAETKAAEARTEAAQMVGKAESSISELKTLLDPKKIKDKAAYKALEAEVRELEATLTAAKGELESDFLAALDKTLQVIDKLAAAKEKAISLVKGNKK